MKPNSRMGGVRIAAAVLLLVLIVSAIVFLPVKELLLRILEWTDRLGPAGYVVVGALYTPAAVFMVPGTLMTLACGFLFGVGWGTVVASLGSTVGASAAFLVGRTLARDWVAGKLAGNPRFRALDDAVGRQETKVVLLTRLSPILPFNLLNYAFGLTKVSFWRYVLASWAGMFPATLVFVYIGSTVESFANLAAGQRPRTVAEQVLFYAGLAATVAVMILLTRMASRALRSEGMEEKRE